MQLFIIDPSPLKAAASLADCHVRKQILETAQILTAAYVKNYCVANPKEWMPKPQNYNHPVVKPLENKKNLSWTINHFLGLLIEFRYRFGKAHAYEGLVDRYANTFESVLKVAPFAWLEETRPEFCRMFSGFEPKSKDLVEAYREYYQYKCNKIKNFKYTKRSKPAWLEYRVCNRCGKHVTLSDNPEYSYQCFKCDEDLYEFETRLEK